MSTALEKKVLAARGQEGRPCHRKERRPPSAEATAEAAADPRPGRAAAPVTDFAAWAAAARPLRARRGQGRPGGRQAGIAARETASHHGKGDTAISIAIPAAGQDEPEGAAPGGWRDPGISVPVSVMGDAAELMALVAELIKNTGRDSVIRTRIEALLEAKGAEPRPAADWMITCDPAPGRGGGRHPRLRGHVLRPGPGPLHHRRPGTQR